MKRRIFLALLLMSVALPGASRARAQDGAQTVPPDRITLEEFKTLRADNKILVLDVRIGATTKIKGAKYIPLDQLETRMSELPRDREIVTYCSWPQEHTSARAAQILNEKGFKARALLGGFNAWASTGGETEPVSEATSTMPQPGKDAQQQQQTLTIASPNPTIDDSKTPATDAPKTTEVAPVKADAATTDAPMKPAKKSKPKPRRAKPRS